LHTFLRFFALLLAAITVAVGVTFISLRPTELKVAVPESNTLDTKVFRLASETLRTQRASVRLEMVSVANTKVALEQLEAGKVHLAVVRSDAALQGRAHTVMILRREAAIIVSPKVGKFQKVTDLPGTTIGVAREGPVDASLIGPVLDYYGLSKDKTKFVPVAADDVSNVFKMKKADAIIVVGAVTSKQVSDVIADAGRSIKGAIQFLDIEEADAIAKRIPALESIEVEQGAFGGRPPRPAESFNTLGFSLRLVATPKVTADTVTDLIRQLYLIRQNLSAAIQGAGLMETPDVEEMTAFLIHPGVRAYVNGEQRSWFDKYGDYLYVAMFLGGGLGSVAAGTFGWMRGRRLCDPTEPIRNIEAVLNKVRDAQTRDELDAAESEADAVFRKALDMGAKGELQAGGLASFDMAMTELRSRMAARRAALG